MSLHNQPKAQFRENMEELPRTSRDGGDKGNNYVDGRSIYDRPDGKAEFQKFVFRGHKAKFQPEGPKFICDACGTGITSGTLVTAEPFHYHESCCKCGKCGVDLNGEYYKRNDSLLCQKCYEPTCALCNDKIRAGQGFVRYAEQWSHRKCFNCTKCKAKLSIDKFFLIKGQPACPACGEYLSDSE